MVPRGLRNNNPCNIRSVKSKWQGMREKQSDKHYVQFKSRKWGYRATFVLLRNYIAKGADTIGKIVRRWAPSSDGNNTLGYIDFVSRTTGIDSFRSLKFEDKESMIEIVRSMAQMECGIIEQRRVLDEAYNMV